MARKPAPSRLEQLCISQGLKMTEQREVVARVLSEARDHLGVEELYQRASAVNPRISLATVYRTVRLFENLGMLKRRDFGDGRVRYEQVDDHHDHLIDMKTGKVIEFENAKIEALQREVARELGYHLVDHRLELYGVPLPDDDE